MRHLLAAGCLRLHANFLERRCETVRKVPEAPETWAHKVPKPARSAPLDPIDGPNTRPERHSRPFSDSFKAKEIAEFYSYEVG
jgi:hypothetical protein